METFARHAGVSKTTVQNWEAGTDLKGGNLLKVSDLFGVHPSELVSADDEGRLPALLQREVAYPSLKAFLEENEESQEITPEERNWLASQQFPDDVDIGDESWWQNQLMLYRGLKIRSAPRTLLHSVKPSKPENERRKK